MLGDVCTFRKLEFSVEVGFTRGTASPKKLNPVFVAPWGSFVCHDQTAPTDKLLRAQQVAERLSVHVSTVYRLADSGRLRAHRLGEGHLRRRGLRVPESAVEEYLQASEITPRSEAAA